MPAFFFVVNEGDALSAAGHGQPGSDHGDDQALFAEDGNVHEDFLVGVLVLGDGAADLGKGPVATFGFRRGGGVAAEERGGDEEQERDEQWVEGAFHGGSMGGQGERCEPGMAWRGRTGWG